MIGIYIETNIFQPESKMKKYWKKSVVQQNTKVTRRIVLTHLTKALYKFGCFKEKVWLFLKYWIWQRCYFTQLPWDNFVCMVYILWKNTEKIALFPTFIIVIFIVRDKSSRPPTIATLSTRNPWIIFLTLLIFIQPINQFFKNCHRIPNWNTQLINNRFLRVEGKRHGGVASTPKMEYQVFLCIFQRNSAMAT